jgi:DtxR family Mn-dependent transcriptional regulator
VSDIAARMGVTKASASNAANLLANKGLIRKEDYRGLSLTSEGLKQAMLLSNKHKIIQRFLREVLSVDPSVADKDACSFEHAISLESLHSMSRYLEDHGKVKTKTAGNSRMKQAEDSSLLKEEFFSALSRCRPRKSIPCCRNFPLS